MAVAMRDRVAELAAKWRREGYELDLGLGIARGYATLGAIGFEGRWDYAALGTVTNLAARLCGEARPGQILVAARVLAALDELVDVEALGEVSSQGIPAPGSRLQRDAAPTVGPPPSGARRAAAPSGRRRPEEPRGRRGRSSGVATPAS